MTVTSNSTSTLSQFASALAKQQIQILDLTNKLSADTPALRLPDPFPNLVDFSLENVAHFNDEGPFWSHNNIATVSTSAPTWMHRSTGSAVRTVKTSPRLSQNA